jgi:hypothetical protein
VRCAAPFKRKELKRHLQQAHDIAVQRITAVDFFM